MKTLQGLILAALVALPAGCSPRQAPPPAPETLPSVTLTVREDKGDQVMLSFLFEHMERANWKNRVLRAQIIRFGGSPVIGGPVMKNPPDTVSFAVGVAKQPGSVNVLFVPMWGKAAVPDESLDLPAPGGQTNLVTLPSYGPHRVRQVLTTCTGPDRAIPFQPDKGVDLITVGYGAESYGIRVWAEPGH